jgi:group I intron endonuclease
MVVYGVKRKETGEIVYVGQAVDLKKRIRTHKSAARNDPKWPIGKAFSKYGWVSFEFVVLETSECRAQLNLFEMAQIAKYRPKYNMTKGGAGKASKGHKSWNKGMKYDKERLNKLREAWSKRDNKDGNRKPVKHLQTGKIYRGSCDAAGELGLSNAHVSQVLHGTRPHTKGHTFSFDLSAPIQQPYPLQIVIRPVRHDETGIVYKDMGEASRALKIPAPNIRKVLIGERKAAGGQHFFYAD